MDSEIFEARVDARPRSPAARAMYQMAARRGVYGPYRIATRIRKRRGEGPTGSTLSLIFNGQYRKPSPNKLRAFVEGFDLFPLRRRVFRYLTLPRPPLRCMVPGLAR